MEVLDLGSEGKYQQECGEGRNQWCYQASCHSGQMEPNPWKILGDGVEHTSQNDLSCRVGSQDVYPLNPALGRGLLPEEMRAVHYPATSGYQAK